MLSSLRRIGAILCVPLALVLTGCGGEYQTLQPYTPAEGVNQVAGTVKVRNVLVIADDTGQGVISGSVVSSSDETLTAAAGVPHKVDGTAGSPLVVTASGLPLAMPANTMFVLTTPPVRLAVSSPDLKPGLLAEVTLTFAKAGPVTVLAPVLSSSDPKFAGITVG